MFRSPDDRNNLKSNQVAHYELPKGPVKRHHHQQHQQRRNNHDLATATSRPNRMVPMNLASPFNNQHHQLAPVNQLDAVIIRNLIYEIGRKTILNRINLTVPEGSIYGLLGPSGCGKTTMLKCIVGRIRPTNRSGSVLVFGLRPGAGLGEVPGRDVGYMPQEISIYEDFTIEETLRYFGKINRMPTSEIKERIQFLLQFLDLPPKTRTVANLSGGQKRRVSLAAALVHSPPLLILDEPTVGVDPLLRQNIWKHLVALTKTERISVIITTHYIEEARLANVVGLMRNGRILAEDSPDELMHRNGLTNLEDVFLKLCVTDSSRRATQLATSGKGSRRLAQALSTETASVQQRQSRRHNRHSRRRHRQQLRGDKDTADRKDEPAGFSEDFEDDNGGGSRRRAASIWHSEASPNRLGQAANDSSKATTVRIHTGTNKIELVHGGRVNEAVEVFSSEDEANDNGDGDDDDNDDDNNGAGDRNYAVVQANSQLGSPVGAGVGVGQALHDSLVTTTSDGGDTDNYLALQNMHWAARRTNVANLRRLNGRNLNKGPYLGLDGRRSHKGGGGHYEQSNGFVQWWKTLMAVTWKNYVRLRRNPPVLVFQFMLPAIQVILFCLCIGGEPFDVPVAIVNEELVPKSSLQFLNGLNRKIIRQIKYDNLSSAIEAVKRGHVWGAIHIPDKYSENLQSRLIMGEDVTNETISNGTIRVYPDLTNLHLALTLETTFRETFINFARNSLEELGYDRSLADLPIQIARPIYGTLRKDGYLEFMAPGVVISISYVMATGLTALAFILERRDGLLERSLVSGVQTSQILLAHAINQVFVMIIQIFLVLGCTFFIFEIPSRGPFFWVVLLILLQGCTGMGFGLLVSAICAEENTAVMMVVGTFYTNLILAGIIWPIEAMPHWLRPVSYAQPQTLPTDTLRHILSRGWSVDEPGVLLGFAVTIGWLVVFLVAAGVIFKYSR